MGMASDQVRSILGNPTRPVDDTRLVTGGWIDAGMACDERFEHICHSGLKSEYWADDDMMVRVTYVDGTVSLKCLTIRSPVRRLLYEWRLIEEIQKSQGKSGAGR
jgi:hypothetical protein